MKNPNAERNAKIIDYWQNDYKYDEIAKYMKVSRNVVAGVIDRYQKRMGLKPHRKMAEVEITDTIIRFLDYAAGFDYDIDSAVDEKLEYNKERQDHSYEARERADGKKW